MRNVWRNARRLLLLWTLTLSLGCGSGVRVAQRATRAEPLRVFAAASLVDLLEALRPGMEATAQRPVVIVTGSSATLARQILQAAPADVFVSAHPRWMAELDRGGLLAAGAQASEPWLRNSLVCIVPADTARAPQNLDALGAPFPGVLALAAESAPLGAYARAAFRAAGVPLPAHVVEGRNARDTLARVAVGGAGAGIVYATDVRVEPRVRVAFLVDATLHGAVAYHAAVLARAADPAACGRLLAYLHGPAARSIVTAHGFTPA